MIIRSLSLSNFRLYKEATFVFEGNVNGIIGNNAVGKTTLLEAIYLALFGRSFRTSELKDLIREGESYFRIEIDFIKNDIEQKIAIYQSLKERCILHNSTLFPHLSSLLGILQGVLIAPGDMNILMGSPSERRRFLDMQISQIDPLYVRNLQRYIRAMKHRNCLLKSGNIQGIQSFEQEMASSAAYITQQRQLCVAELSSLCQTFYAQLSQDREVLSIQYSPEKSEKTLEELTQSYIDSFNRLRIKELAIGHTLQGPHKHDLSFMINQRQARYFGSEGQKNSAIIALKLAEWSLLSLRSQQKPIFMIDDLSLNLDSFRLRELCKMIVKTGQSYFSAVSKPAYPFDKINWINVNI